MRRTITVAVGLACGAALAGPAAPSKAATYKVIYRFGGGRDGAYPFSSLINVGGTLYGTTQGGGTGVGAHKLGTVFSLNPTTGTEKVIYSFHGRDGAYPTATLTRVGIRLYGTTTAGGSANCTVGCGTVFSLQWKTGAVKTRYQFQGGIDGANPAAGLTNVGGILFGVTSGGGSGNGCACGTVFSFNPTTSAKSVLYSFGGGTEVGVGPSGPLINFGGTLVGETEFGPVFPTLCGGAGCGTLYWLDPTTGDTTGDPFGGGSDGQGPSGGLFKDGGTLYGTTLYGGSSTNCTSGCGTVFSVTPSSEHGGVLWSFQGASDGATPESGVIKIGGTLYGTTGFGGSLTCLPGGCGTIFAVNATTGAEEVLHRFQGGYDGAGPYGGLLNVAGKLYGTTTGGGSKHCEDGCGTVFSFTP